MRVSCDVYASSRPRIYALPSGNSRHRSARMARVRLRRLRLLAAALALARRLRQVWVMFGRFERGACRRRLSAVTARVEAPIGRCVGLLRDFDIMIRLMPRRDVDSSAPQSLPIRHDFARSDAEVGRCRLAAPAALALSVRLARGWPIRASGCRRCAGALLALLADVRCAAGASHASEFQAFAISTPGDDASPVPISRKICRQQ